MSPAGAPLALSLWLCLLGAPGGDANDSAADAVTLRDGKIVAGLIEPSPRGQVWLLVRRAGVREKLPEWADRWEAAEAPAVKRATAARRDRLSAWRRERRATATATATAKAADDRISPWLDREIARLGGADKAEKSPLMEVKLGANEVRSVARAAAAHARLLRLGWLAGLRDPEGMRAADLKDALVGRGYDLSSTAPVPVDSLRPVPLETDSAWAVRRAATEVLTDPGLRFVRYQGIVFPEPENGQPITPATGLAALSVLKGLLDDNPADPLAERLREVAASGRAGAVVTSLDVSPHFGGVSVEMTLWARQSSGAWSAAGSRSARVRPDQLGQGAGNELAEDPQVALAFRAVEAIGLGAVSPEMKQRSLGVGAATRRALGLARTAAQADLAALALPVLDRPKPEAPGP